MALEVICDKPIEKSYGCGNSSGNGYLSSPLKSGCGDYNGLGNGCGEANGYGSVTSKGTAYTEFDYDNLN